MAYVVAKENNNVEAELPFAERNYVICHKAKYIIKYYTTGDK